MVFRFTRKVRRNETFLSHIILPQIKYLLELPELTPFENMALIHTETAVLRPLSLLLTTTILTE